MMLSRMEIMSIIEWCMFSGGCPSKKEHVAMQICIKIVGKESGNVTLNPMQWVDIDYIAFSFHAKKNTTMDNIITISDVHASWVN